MPASAAASPKPGILKQDSQECVSPSSYLGLNYSVSPRSTPKAVTIAQSAETMSPLMLGKQKGGDAFELENEQSSRKHRVKSFSARRMSGRPTFAASNSSLRSLHSLHSLTSSVDGAVEDDDDQFSKQSTHPHLVHLVSEVHEWINIERAKRTQRKARKKGWSGQVSDDKEQRAAQDDASTDVPRRRGSESSESEQDLRKLERILKHTLNISRPSSRKTSSAPLRKLSIKKLHRRKQSTVSSDTDYVDGDILVPSCDAVLDNSKTLAYSGGESNATPSSSAQNTPSARAKDPWRDFKYEIVRLAHTLRLKGWRRVPAEMSGEIEVERLSGALTNAVYVIAPPSELSLLKVRDQQSGATDGVTPRPKAPPAKLLLRVYGPQVEHLIDREAELQILRRLSRKRIGPRMLGTFANGRFEQFFNAQTLTAADLRIPDTSRQIAKRMRELHDGIELLDQEREDGAFVWRNWDKWVQRVEQVVCWLDQELQSQKPGAKPTGPDDWKRRGYICGVQWPVFRQTVERYRKWLDLQYGGSKKVREQLVFAHNDTQYGNILRLVPPGESPLLLPANSHKQLVVIDFEYANANLPGLEFANHFTEWCYNYHNKAKPYVCNTNMYPTPEEQDHFIRAYVRHRPEYNIATPRLAPQQTPPSSSSITAQRPSGPSSSISNFMLDVRNPYFPTLSQQDDEGAENMAEDAEVARLLHETRLWRMANTAQWVAWGLVQAKVPGMPLSSPPSSGKLDPERLEDQEHEGLGERAAGYRELAKEQANGDGADKQEEEQEGEFDYLGYAHHRAMFFWGDAVQLGIAKANELPEEVREKIKVVPY